MIRSNYWLWIIPIMISLNSFSESLIGQKRIDIINPTDINPPIILLDSTTLLIDACNDSSHLFKLKITDESAIKSARIYWKSNIEIPYENLELTKLNDSLFEVKLELNSSKLYYYFEAIDTFDNKSMSNEFFSEKLKLNSKISKNNWQYTRNDTIKITINYEPYNYIIYSGETSIDENSIYSIRANNSLKVYIYKAEELKNAGFKRGWINSISIANINQSKSTSNLIDYFRISVASTSEKTLNSKLKYNFVEVFNVSDYLPIEGLNKHVFNQSYYWDGTSNLVFKFCSSVQDPSYIFENWKSEFYEDNDSTAAYHLDYSMANICNDSFAYWFLNKKPKILLEGSIYDENCSWISPDSNSNILISNSNELIACPTDTGTYQFIKVSIINSCVNYDTIFVKINDYPFLNLKDTMVVCANDLIEISAENDNCNYTWIYNNQIISNNQKIFVNNQGIYKVIITNKFGNIFVDSTYLKQRPIDTNYLGGNITACNVEFYRIESNVIAKKYLWSTGDTSNYLDINRSNKVRSEIVYENGCKSSDDIRIDIGEKIELYPFEFYFPDTSYKYFQAHFDQAYNENARYDWDMDDTLSPENNKNGFKIKHKFVSNKKIYNIKVYAFEFGYPCIYSDTFIFQLVNSSYDINSDRIKLLINPIDEYSTLEYILTDPTNNVHIQLFDLLGREIFEYVNNQKISNGKYSIALSNILNQPKGVYLLNVKLNNELRTYKLINK